MITLSTHHFAWWDERSRPSLLPWQSEGKDVNVREKYHRCPLPFSRSILLLTLISIYVFLWGECGWTDSIFSHILCKFCIGHLAPQFGNIGGLLCLMSLLKLSHKISHFDSMLHFTLRKISIHGVWRSVNSASFLILVQILFYLANIYFGLWFGVAYFFSSQKMVV